MGLVRVVKRGSPDTFTLVFGFVLLGAGIALSLRSLRYIGALPERATRAARRPWIAAALTLFVPGLGQIYGGEPRRALAIYLGNISLFSGLLASGILKAFIGLIGVILVFLLFLLWMIRDAVHIARRKKDGVRRPYNRWYLYYFAVVMVSGFLSPHLVALSPTRSFRIPSASMEPAVLVGDHVNADMTCYRSGKPARGDLVVFTSPDEPASMKIARVIGLEGERIEARETVIYVDGQRLTDPWGRHRNSQVHPSAFLDPRVVRRDNFGPLKIPVGAVFVLGDNRDNSYDSRFFGPIPLSSLRGRLLYVYWATDKWRIGTYLR